MKSRRLSAAILIAALCLILLAGCGSSNSPAPNTGSSTAANSSAVPVQSPGTSTGASSEGIAAPAGTASSSGPTPERRYYHEDEYAFPDFRLSVEAGTYEEPFDLVLSGTDGADVFYTLDGTDPIPDYGSDWLDIAEEALPYYENNSITISTGVTALTIRLIDNDTGAISGPIRATYNIKVPFDTTSDIVDQDAYYEYYALGYLYRHNLLTGVDEPVYQTPLMYSIFRICIANITTTRALSLGEDYARYNFTNPEQIYQWEQTMNDPVCGSLLYLTLKGHSDWPDAVLLLDMVEDMANVWDGEKDTDIYVRHVGNGAWCVYNDGTAKWLDTMTNPVATEEAVIWCDLLTDEIAIKCDTIAGSSTVMAKDPDGTNERVLWSSEDEVFLDAIVRQKVFYHIGTGSDMTHIVYNLTTGEHRANTALPIGTDLLGYTSSGIYIYSQDAERIPLDYDTIEGELIR